MTGPPLVILAAMLHPAVAALAAALLFGASTPFAKLFAGELSPFLGAGLLYLGSGVGLAALLMARAALTPSRDAARALRIPRADLPWLAGAIVAGGVAGPVLLMAGLANTGAAPAALLLNLEGVFTALLAWLVFRENADRRIVLGMAAIVAGGVLLSWQREAGGWSAGALLITAACLCWAIDNNFTRKVSLHDATAIACLKGLVAGACNTGIALLAGTALPPAASVAAIMAVGLFGYGISLTLFVLALRGLGSARTGAYFSVAPLFGVAIALAIWPSLPEPTFWLAALLMGIGVWLHVSERHEHVHTHAPLEHDHRHRHDEHHRHPHPFGWDGVEPHTHAHRHELLTHRHPHYPDAHHRHRH